MGFIKTVLIVDDYKDLRDVLITYLEGKGFLVYTAENGREALELTTLVSIDLIITDLHMPHHSGLWLIEEIRKRKDDVPIILMTGSLLIDCLSEKHASVTTVSKPFRMESLLKVIRAFERIK